MATTLQAADPAEADRAFPVLDPDQLARLEAHGRRRRIEPGEILLRAGVRPTALFAVLTGRLEGVGRSAGTDAFAVTLRPGMFTGEANMLSGAVGFVDMIARESGEVIEVERSELLSLIQTDGELSEIFMRAFVLRRVRIIATRSSDTVLVGSSYCADTLRVREFLTRNGYPFTSLDLDRDEGVQALLDRFQIGPDGVPVVLCRGDKVLRRPTNRRIAECLGFNEEVDRAKVVDVIVVGAGPAGLAAAVYGASEGLEVLVLETTAAGGQAGSSSRIENYLGFPAGISGLELAGRAHNQALKFGAHFMIAGRAAGLDATRRPYTVELDDGERLSARVVIVATGAEYRRLPIEGRDRFDGAGVYYAATPMEAQLCEGEDVIVVGGGNSAGQAAMFLADRASGVHMLVRSELSRSMSRYLVRRIEQHPAVELHVRTRVVRIDGNGHLERVTWHEEDPDGVETRSIRHLFAMTGAVPATAWLRGAVALDAGGFIKTGPDLAREDLAAKGWPLARSPHLLETSRPGVFAVGDARSGSVKRVAAAVGEGSVAIAAVHRVLAEGG